MDALRVRTYNVRFGDAILISFPDQDETGQIQTRHILIDVGNVPSDEGGLDDVFKPIVDDLLATLDDQPLDLYIMTHEHMDHVQGLLYAKEKLHYTDLRDRLQTRYAWLTASAALDYYERFTEAKEAQLALVSAYDEIDGFLKATGMDNLPQVVKSVLWNNSPHRTNDCVEFLQTLAPAESTFYIHRGFDLIPGTHHPFHEAGFEIWAPEEDTAEYYGYFKPMALGVTGAARAQPDLDVVFPPPGVDAGAFYNLVDRRQAYASNLLAIDKAKNNTSVVFCLTWRGWHLLFAGDAEERSWKEMNKEGMLQPVHLLKVSHHASHNGTPKPELVDKILPLQPADDRNRTAVVSTFENTYSGIPHQETLELLGERCDSLHIVHEEVEPGGYIDLLFAG